MGRECCRASRTFEANVRTSNYLLPGLALMQNLELFLPWWLQSRVISTKPVVWSHIPDIAMISDGSKIPPHDVGDYLGLSIDSPPVVLQAAPLWARPHVHPPASALGRASRSG